MAADINVTRRKKLLAYLLENGGTMAIGPLHDWSGLKLLAAHQAFSQLMEGLTSDGLVAWDGTIFTLTDEGRAAAEAAGKEKGRGRKKKDAEETGDDAAAETAGEAAAETAGKAAPPAADEDHGHSHDHGHEHDHGGTRAAPAPMAPAPMAPAPAPVAAPA
ncbi:MAG: hypothetical protein Q8P41_31440, partial [Pseudomonadota bacterium]|nr:hypothetical protein [Pseudomonadota bacterium]